MNKTNYSCSHNFKHKGTYAIVRLRSKAKYMPFIRTGFDIDKKRYATVTSYTYTWRTKR